VSKHRRMQ